jgi:putative transposase
VIKTYSVAHHLTLGPFFTAYKTLLNQFLAEIWDQIRWKEKSIREKTQKRLLPIIPTYAFKKELRKRYLSQWTYAKHWVDSALKTAFAILKSWKKNYLRGNRKRHRPVVKRAFVRVKQTLMKLEGEQLRISIKPREFVYIDLSHRYFKLDGKLGEPILTPTQIHLPLQTSAPDNGSADLIAWDSNKFSLDGFSPHQGWLKLDLRPLHTLHMTYENKRRRLNQLYARNKRKGQALYQKYRRRERHRVHNYLCHLIKALIALATAHGFEALDKQKMNRRNKKRWNRELQHTDWRKIVTLLKNKAPIREVTPYYTSKMCARCGYLHQDLRGEQIFECPKCGLRIDRQLNAAINIYLKMRGVSHKIAWFDRIVCGGFPLIGAETRTADELARRLDELMKPQVYICIPIST